MPLLASGALGQGRAKKAIGFRYRRNPCHLRAEDQLDRHQQENKQVSK
jgi:hypothetical protein